MDPQAGLTGVKWPSASSCILRPMILKEGDKVATGDAMTAAGQRAERQMAFYLERGFGDTADVLVMNDLRLVLNESGDAAQMDHLIVHRHGMVIVESKSVTSRVTINAQGEWARWWNGKWKGMASPVEQARRQAEALRELLQGSRESLRDRKLFGLVQGGFRHCPIDIFIAISDDGMFDAGSVRPPGVLKAEAIVGEVRALFERHRKGASFLGGMNSKPDEGAYLLTDGELGRVTGFLLARHVPRAAATAAPAAPPLSTPAPGGPPSRSSGTGAGGACKHCGGNEGEAQWGKYGYYLKCASCGKNTGLEKRCAACGREARIRKDGPRFWRECLVPEGGCGAAVVVWENRG